MGSPQFAIPKEFQHAVRYVEPHDQRSDEEILEALTKHVPIKSEKNIWAFWHSGVLSMPSWCQRNVVNWVRLCGPSWTLRVLDNVPGSLNNALSWVPAEILPETFMKGTMDGPYTGPHSADFLRGAALFEYGGNMLKQLEDPKSSFHVSASWMFRTHMANHFVASRKGDAFIKRWHDLFIHLWKDQHNCDHIIENPLVQFGKAVKFEDSEARGFKWDFKVQPQIVMGYIAQVLSWDRLCMLEDPNDGFNGRDYYAKKVLLFDSLTEDWSVEDTVGFEGQDFFNVLTTRLDADPESKEYQDAYKAIWRMLTNASMQKITHGKELTKTPACGVLLDKKENEDKDVAPGTFASLLRYGTIHFEQLRDTIDYID